MNKTELKEILYKNFKYCKEENHILEFKKDSIICSMAYDMLVIKSHNVSLRFYISDIKTLEFNLVCVSKVTVNGLRVYF